MPASLRPIQNRAERSTVKQKLLTRGKKKERENDSMPGEKFENHFMNRRFVLQLSQLTKTL